MIIIQWSVPANFSSNERQLEVYVISNSSFIFVYGYSVYSNKKNTIIGMPERNMCLNVEDIKEICSLQDIFEGKEKNHSYIYISLSLSLTLDDR